MNFKRAQSEGKTFKLEGTGKVRCPVKNGKSRIFSYLDLDGISADLIFAMIYCFEVVI
jgi:hypothetical protein